MSAADLLQKSEYNKQKQSDCVFCGDFHENGSCNLACNMSLQERKNKLLQKGACFSCFLRNHKSRFCRNKTYCNICQLYGHHHLLCNYSKGKVKQNSNVDLSGGKSQGDPDGCKNGLDLSNQSNFKDVYLQTLILTVKGESGDYYLRGILDSAAQNTYVTGFAARVIKPKRLNEVMVNHCLFGAVEKTETHNRYKLNVSSIDNSYQCEMYVLEQENICTSIPQCNNRVCIRELKRKRIFVNDVFFDKQKLLFQKDPLEINFLIGADYAGKLYRGNVCQLPTIGLTAIKTKLGWTLMGRENRNKEIDGGRGSNAALSLSLLISDQKISDLWKLDVIGISDREEQKSRDILESETVQYFNETIKQNEGGRFEIALPWVVEKESLPDNLNLSQKCLDRVEKRLENGNNKSKYEDVFHEWETMGIIERVWVEKGEIKSEENTHYLPHRPVIKESSKTTKIRPVFNASAKMKNSASLNDCLTKGPNLIEMIPRMLNHFRKYRIAVSSDIEKAFLQICVREEDRDYLRFLWRDANQNTIVYRHARIPFGLNSSPFLLAATLNHLLDQMSPNYETTVQTLKESFYVDNCLTSLNSVEEVEKFVKESQEILSLGKFNLRDWQSNVPNSVIQESSTEIIPVLGLIWDLKNDTLACKIDSVDDDNGPVTKRKILSLTQRIFDPVGFTSPVTLIPKLLLQEIWNLGLKWDEEVPHGISKSFKSWLRQLNILTEIKIPRWLFVDPNNEGNLSLHVFCDASKRAYATCIYLRSEHANSTTVRLVNAKSRVAPIKPLTIPRLELLACLIGARLLACVKTDLKLENVITYCWTDSTTALAWIRNEEKWSIYVYNRVNEIRELTKIKDWRFVPGHLNFADLPSRGCSANRLSLSDWWEGPKWLKEDSSQWPQMETEPDCEIINTEKRKTIISAVNISQDIFEYFDNISSYTKILRVTAWINRFLQNTRIKSTLRKTGKLEVAEIEEAEKIVIRALQKNCKKENIKNLNIFTDTDGIMKTKTRISNREDSKSFCCPIILPSKNSVTRKLIVAKHRELDHAGVQTLMSHIREKFWLVKSRKTIRQAIRNCVICKRFCGRPVEVCSPPLPLDRVKDAYVFQNTGVDACGPLHLKDGSKCWIILFTCAVYRGVHLELITSLSTDNFILAVRRFIARRGRPETFHCDNGKNFVGARNELETVEWNKMEDFAISKRINWKMNPPSSPWWGGFWERLIGMLKKILRKMLGNASLNYEEINTILCDAESQLNSRPLTYMSEDIQDLIPLTPAMFMQEIQEIGTPDLDQLDAKKANKRVIYRRKLRQDLRDRFRVEYLGQLRNFSNHRKEYQVKEGEVVLLGETNTKRINWPLAIITKIYPGKDGKTRVVEIKTKSGYYLRPVQKLYPLELNEPETLPVPKMSSKNDNESNVPQELEKSNNPQDKEKKTRYGRIIKQPKRFQSQT